MILSCLETIVSQFNPSGFPNDAVPPILTREVFPSEVPLVVAVMNSSLSSGMVPQQFKHAVVQPLIVKRSRFCSS